MKMKSLTFGLLALATDFLSAATLNVDFEVRTRIPETDGGVRRKNVAIFVLDRSGSMKGAAINGERGRSRNYQLVESVRERVMALAETQLDTDVYLLPFSSRIGKMMGPYSLGNKSQVNELVKWDGFAESNCEGVTLLYDTLAYALDFAEGLVQADPLAKVKVYGYTDGENYTPLSRIVNENIDSFWSSKVAVQYPTKTEGDASEIGRAYKLFAAKYNKKIEQFVMAGKMDDIQWRWLGAGNPPPGIKNIRKDEYAMRLSSESPALKNPAAVAEQTMPAVLTIPIPSKYEKDLDGLSATLALDMDGRRISSKVLPLGAGRRTVAFQVPDQYARSGKFSGKLSLLDVPDAWDRVLLKEPAPLDLSFAAPDALSFLAFAPGDDVFVRTGEKISFSAKASDGATVCWSVKGGESFSGEAFEKTFTNPGAYRVTAKAEKTGFVPAVRELTVTVIDASVEVSVATDKPIVGEKVSFVAHAKGTPEGYSWWIDGQSVAGKGERLGDRIFDRSGKHSVKVRAIYPHGISADSPASSFDVAAKPSVVIEDPLAGSEFGFGEKVECKALVEGDFEKVVWKIAGPAGEERSSPVVAAERTAKAVFKPAKGGQYELTATASGAAGTLTAKTSVKFKVARENMGVEIVSPASGSLVELGAGVNGMALKATVKGESVREIKWTMLNRKTGRKTDLRTTPVQSGVASCAFPNDPSIGDGVTLVVQAEAVLPKGEEPLRSAPVELVSSLVAEMDVEAKVDGKEANGREVKFGDQVDLVAVCRGGVDPDKVQWFAEANGKERAIGTGPRCTTPGEEPAGDNLRTVRYFAKAKLADGSFKLSRKVIVHHHCPDFKAAIRLPKGADGITRTSFGLKDAVRAEIELSAGAELVDVVWNMGDGTTYKGLVVSHPHYAKYGEYAISAAGKCKNCGKSYALNPVKVRVEKQKPVAAFVIEEKGTYYTVGGKLHLRSTSTGDICALKWAVDGVELTEFADKNEAVVRLPGRPGELNVTLTATGLNGADPSVAEREVRVRFGWLAIVVLALLALLFIGIFAWLFLNNGPAGWQLKLLVGPRPDTSSAKSMNLFKEKFKGGYRSGVIGHFWSLTDKSALMPIAKLATYSKSKSFPGLKVFAKACNAKAAVKVKKGNSGTPVIQGSSLSKEDIGLDSVLNDKRFMMFASEEHEGRERQYLSVAIDSNRASYGYVAWFVLLSLAVITGCAWAMMRYAI